MILPKGTVVAVADGEKFSLFSNTGDEANLKLVGMPAEAVPAEGGASSGRSGSSANPDHGQDAEDQFAAGIVQHLNQQALSGDIANVVIIAAPRALGEMRQHYHKALSDILLAEIAKDLTGHTLAEIERALEAA